MWGATYSGVFIPRDERGARPCGGILCDGIQRSMPWLLAWNTDPRAMTQPVLGYTVARLPAYMGALD